MKLSKETVLNAMANAATGHKSKPEVNAMLEDMDAYADRVIEAIEIGSYVGQLTYREFMHRNSNGKMRHIESPDLFTRVLQHVFIVLVQHLYDKMDPHIGMNCKKGYGITANQKGKSVARRVKNALYDRREYHYGVIIDQRKCYDHMTRKLFRKAMKLLTDDRELIDFGTEVTFHGKSFPIGTPTSPLAHHIIMLAFDRWLGSINGIKIRYADDCFLCMKTREEAQQAIWRIKQFWWFTYHLRAKRGHSKVINLDREPISFCGFVYRRNLGKGVCDHNKGYCVPRQNIKAAARKCHKDTSWASYYGILSKTDFYRSMKEIETKMKLSELTSKIKIERDFDAEPIAIGDLARHEFTIYDYELRYNTVEGTPVPTWLRIIIGINEIDDLGMPTGNIKRYCCKTEATGMVQFIAKIDEYVKMSGRSPFPLEECRIENVCGYMFKGSTTREMYCTESNMTLPKSSLSSSLRLSQTKM
jgi:hypothetical protein